MDIITCMAAVAVADLDQAKRFYGGLFGRGPDLEPMATLAQWDLPNGSAFQVVDDPSKAGSGMATLVVSNVEQTVAALRHNGLPVGDIIDGVLSPVAQLQDPAGNSVTLVEPPHPN